jgi:hypothetical protein
MAGHFIEPALEPPGPLREILDLVREQRRLSDLPRADQELDVRRRGLTQPCRQKSLHTRESAFATPIDHSRIITRP